MSEEKYTTEYRDLASVIGFSGYRIGSDGSLWSLRRGLNWTKMKGNKHGDYLRATLSYKGETKRKLIHNLVLAAFIGPAPDGMLCRHKNGNGLDNRLDNLCWGTPKENAEDMMQHGNHFKASGELNGEAKLNDDDVLEIRAKYLKGGCSQRSLAEEYEMSQSSIWRAIHAATWHHI